MSFTSESRWSDVAIATVARAVSVCGDFLAATALLLALQQRGAGSYAVAALLLAAAVPPVVLVRWSGRLADRVDSRLLLIATGLGQAAVCLTMVFVSNAIALVALVAVLAGGYAVTQPTLAALMPAMVRRDDLARASALGQTATSVGLLIAPALAGVLVGQFGLRIPLLFDAASYLAIVAAGLALRTRRRGGAPAARPASGPATASGPAAVTAWRARDDRLVWTMMVLIGAVIAAVSAINVVDVFFVRGVLHSSTTMYGLLSAVWTGTMMIGAWLLTRRTLTDSGVSWAMVVALVVTCVDVLGLAAVPSVAVLLPLFVIGGISNGVENVAAGLMISRRTPDEFRGRAYAVYGAVANGANALGFLLGGVVLGVLSVRVTIAVAGAFGLAVTMIFAVPLLRAAARDRAGRPGGTPMLPSIGEPAEVAA
jgi:MFS family permease